MRAMWSFSDGVYAIPGVCSPSRSVVSMMEIVFPVSRLISRLLLYVTVREVYQYVRFDTRC